MLTTEYKILYFPSKNTTTNMNTKLYLDTQQYLQEVVGGCQSPATQCEKTEIYSHFFRENTYFTFCTYVFDAGIHVSRSR